MTRFVAAIAAASLFSSLVSAAEPVGTVDSPAKHSLVTSNKLLGATIKNGQNESLGTVNSLIMNRNGEVQFLIAGTGGIGGLGQSEVAIPVRAAKIQCGLDEGKKVCSVQVPMTAEKLSKAPALENTHAKELTDANWVQANAEYFSAAPPSEPLNTVGMVCLRSVNDADVQAAADQSVGHLDAVIVDLNKLQAKYAIIGDGGTLGVGEKYFAVPFASLNFSKNAENEWKVSTSATPAAIKAAPQVTPAEYPELDQQATRDRIDKSLNKTTN